VARAMQVPPCLYIGGHQLYPHFYQRYEDNSVIILLKYVDDMLGTSDNTTLAFETWLTECFNLDKKKKSSGLVFINVDFTVRMLCYDLGLNSLLKICSLKR